MKSKQAITVFFLMAFLLPGALRSQAPVEEKTPSSPLAEAVKLYKAGLYQEAIDAFIRLGNKSTNKTERMKTQIFLGYTYFTLENKEEAERAVRNGIVLKQDAELNDRSLFPEIDAFVPDFVKFFKSIKDMIVGSVFIESIPSGATVYIDSAKAGVTPMTAELAYQKYSFKFVKWGYSVRKMNVDFKKSDLGNIKMNLNEGRKHWKSFLQSALLMAGFSFLIGSI